MTSTGFQGASWLFTSNFSNRGIIRQDFNEAALLWEAASSTRGPILEIGRRYGGGTSLLLMASRDRVVVSIDSAPQHHPSVDRFFTRPEISARLTLLVADSRKPIAGAFGFMFIDGDHSYEGVRADVCAHWRSLQSFEGIAPSAVFHDAAPNDQGPTRRSSHHEGVRRVCEELVLWGCARELARAGSSLWLEKVADLPAKFLRGSDESKEAEQRASVDPSEAGVGEILDQQELLARARKLISELRNRRNVAENWAVFRELMKSNQETVINTFSSRWLISVCDTFADHAEGEQARNALLVSLMFNMIRLSDSLYEDRDIRAERVAQIREGWPAFYDGLQALNLDRQDTCLNLSKRLTRAFEADDFTHRVFRELLRRAKLNDNLVSRFMRRSAKPEWVFPEQPLGIVDNYGIV